VIAVRKGSRSVRTSFIIALWRKRSAHLHPARPATLDHEGECCSPPLPHNSLKTASAAGAPRPGLAMMPEVCPDCTIAIAVGDRWPVISPAIANATGSTPALPIAVSGDGGKP
jgi:hypothetical protein